MAVIHFNANDNQPKTRRIIPMKRMGLQGEIWFGAAVAATVLAGSLLTAYNGGISLKTEDMEMTLSGSLSKGLHLSFASVANKVDRQH